MSIDVLAIAAAVVLAAVSTLTLVYNARLRRAGRPIPIPLQSTPLFGYVMAVLAVVFLFVPGIFHQH